MPTLNAGAVSIACELSGAGPPLLMDHGVGNSCRRLAFNNNGIFRCYPELDG